MKVYRAWMAVGLVIVGCGGMCMAQQGSMTAAEKLTEDQSKRLHTAEAAVVEAQQKVLEVQKQIAAEHHFKEERWMEWAVWYEFDGDFIISRHADYMIRYQMNAGKP